MQINLTTDGGFRMEGDIDDTFQLIFEALEIAAASNDVYAPEFGALAQRLAEATAHWIN